MRAIRLKTEHLTAPMGVDFTAPQLFWNCEGGVRQTAWQILAADDGGNLLWDSGKRCCHARKMGRKPRLS